MGIKKKFLLLTAVVGVLLAVVSFLGYFMAQRALDASIAASVKRGATAMTLEVRPSNAPALALYHHFDFEEVGRRKGYYSDNGEDAIIMWNTKL